MRKKSSKNKRNNALLLAPSPALVYVIFACIIGLVLPVLLLPWINMTGNTVVIEEVVKALVVLIVILKIENRYRQALTGVLFGALFGISESALYLNQIIQLGDLTVFAQRLVWTVPMHAVTAGLLTLSTRFGKPFIIFGITVAILVHAIFNTIALSFIA